MNRLITAEDKDAIIDLIIEKANERMISQLEYEEVRHLGITRGMYEIILSEMTESGLFKRCGYSYFFELKAGIFRIKEYGGYTMERDAYFEGLKNLSMQLEKARRDLSPTLMMRIDEIIGKCKNATELTESLSRIYELLCQRN